MSQFDRSELVSLAERCYENNCHKDVISYMKKVIKMPTPLKYGERCILFYSYDYLILPYLDLYSSANNSSFPDEKLRKEIKLKAQSETNRLSNDAIRLLDSNEVKSDTSIEAVAHYKYFLADQYDNKTRVSSGTVRIVNDSEASKLFEEAYEIANKNLNPAHPIVIDIAISYSEFIYHSLGSVDKALKIATEAHDKALPKLSGLSEELKKFAKKRLELLSEEINEWKN